MPRSSWPRSATTSRDRESHETERPRSVREEGPGGSAELCPRPSGGDRAAAGSGGDAGGGNPRGDPSLLVALRGDRASELEPGQPLRGELSAARDPGPAGGDRHHQGDHREPGGVGGGGAVRAGSWEAESEPVASFGISPEACSSVPLGSGLIGRAGQTGEVYVADPGGPPAGA